MAAVGLDPLCYSVDVLNDQVQVNAILDDLRFRNALEGKARCFSDAS